MNASEKNTQLSETQVFYISTLITLLTGIDGSCICFDAAVKDWTSQAQVDFYIQNLHSGKDNDNDNDNENDNDDGNFKHWQLNYLISSSLDPYDFNVEAAAYADEIIAIEAYESDEIVRDEVRKYVYTKISKLIADSIIEVLHIDGEVTL